MPLYKIINFSATTQILVWKINESYEQLFLEVQLNVKSWERLKAMKSQLHQRAFLSVRKLLQHANLSDFDLFYDALGKPFLTIDKHISISHSHEFSAIIISNQKAGIDIELQREKIIGIADKFVNNDEKLFLRTINREDYIKELTVKWGAKEAIFKIRNEPGISFKNHIKVHSYEIQDQETTAILEMENVKQQFAVYFEEFENFTLVYAFEN